jgi:hypothetical protein
MEKGEKEKGKGEGLRKGKTAAWSTHPSFLFV